MDKTGLFYREMPKYTLAKISDDGAGAKEDKSRITVLFSVNGDGSKKNIYLIGKSKTPKGVNKKFFDENNVEYFSNSSAWMDREIFTKIISEMDRNLNTPTIVIIDNFSGHKLTEPEKLKNIILVFLPPNTSKTQPLDLGIISAFKFKFQKFLLSYFCDNLQRKNFKMNEIDIKRIFPWIFQDFDLIRRETIIKCFFKSLKLAIIPLEQTGNDDFIND